MKKKEVRKVSHTIKLRDLKFSLEEGVVIDWAMEVGDFDSYEDFAKRAMLKEAVAITP